MGPGVQNAQPPGIQQDSLNAPGAKLGGLEDPPCNHGRVYFFNMGQTTDAFAASCPPLLFVQSVT